MNPQNALYRIVSRIMSVCQSPLFKKALENENNALITTLTTKKINTEKLLFLRKLGLSPDVMQDYMEKLKGYRHVDDLNGVLHGAYIRWIDLKRPDRLTLARGAIICDIKIGQNGVLLLCKTHPSPAMFHVSMDEALIFQRLTPQERIILVAMDYMDTSTSTKGSESEGSEGSQSEGSEDSEGTGLSGTH